MGGLQSYSLYGRAAAASEDIKVKFTLEQVRGGVEV
jgi:hypothetical protein